MAISSGPRPRAQRWSRAIYEAFPEADGILYGSSMHANAPALALYERCVSALPTIPLFRRALADPALEETLETAADSLGYALTYRRGR